MEKNTNKSSANGKDAKSIRHALEILNEAAKSSRQDIESMIESDFVELKKTFSTHQPRVKQALHEIRDASYEGLENTKEQIVNQTKETAQNVDKTVKENPWPYLGIAAGVSAVIGYLLGRNSQ